ASINTGLLNFLFGQLLRFSIFAVGSGFILCHQLIGLGSLMRGIDTIDLHIAVLIVVHIIITRDRNSGGTRAIIGQSDHHQVIGVFFAVINTGVKVAQLLFVESVALCIGTRVCVEEQSIDSALDIISRALVTVSVTAQVQDGS